MAFLQGNYSGPARNSFAISDFTGGIVNRTDQLAPNQFQDMVNIDFEHDHTIRKRRGYRQRTDVSYTLPSGGGDIIFYDHYEPYTGSSLPVYSTETTHGFWTGSSWDIHSGKILSGVNHNGMYIYTVNGVLMARVDMNGVTLGTYTKEWGTRPAGRFLNYRIWYPTELGFTLDESHTRGITQFDYFRMDIMYYPCINELNDPYKGINVPPRKIGYIEGFKGRLYTSVIGPANDDDVIYISDVGNPFYFPPGTGLSLQPNGDGINGLCAYDDGVVIFRKHDAHIVRGETNNPTLGLQTYSVNQLNTVTGLHSPESFSKAETYLFYLGSDNNVYALSSTYYNDKQLNVQVLNKTVDLTQAPFHFPTSTTERVFTEYHDNRFYIFYGNKFITYNFNYMSWIRNESNLYARTTCITPENVMEIVTSNKNVNIFDKSVNYTSDNGLVFSSHFKTGRIDLGTPFNQKLYKFSHVISKWYNNKVTGTFNYIIDGKKHIPSLDYATKKATFGNTRFGEARVAEHNDRAQSERIPINYRGYSMEIAFSQSENEPFKFYNIDVEYEMRGRK